MHAHLDNVAVIGNLRLIPIRSSEFEHLMVKVGTCKKWLREKPRLLIQVKNKFEQLTRSSGKHSNSQCLSTSAYTPV